MMHNKMKYLSYKGAWNRINSALESGYYLEVVTICESIITDRMLSYVRGVCPNAKADLHSSFYQIIKECRELVHQDELKLIDEVNIWRTSRNKVVHGIVKSSPGLPTENYMDFIHEAKLAAEEGKKLARNVSDWHKKNLLKK